MVAGQKPLLPSGDTKDNTGVDMGLFGNKKPKEKFVKCGHKWTEKRWVGDPKTGHWTTYQRTCSKKKGHFGGHG